MTVSTFNFPFIKPQFFTNSGVILTGGKLNVYLAGSVTRTPTYTTAAGTVENTNPIIMDAYGRCNIFLNSLISYKFVMTDMLDNELWTEDNVSGIAPFSTSITQFGADPTGVLDSSAAIAAAIAAMSNPGFLTFPQGRYKLNKEILVPSTGPNGSGKHFHFENCELFPGNDSMNLIHWSDCRGSTSGRVNFTSNSKTGIKGFALTPELDNLNTTVANQNFNRFMAHMEFVGLDEAVITMAGLPIAGTSSGCWYNTFYSIFTTSCKRSLWSRDNGSLVAESSGPNSNTYYSFIINGSSNTGFQIDAGGGQHFYSPQFENIQLGTSPNTVPVGVKIASTMANGGAIPDCNFYSPHWENVTRRVDVPVTSNLMYVNRSEVVNSNGGLIPLLPDYPAILTEKGNLVSHVYNIVSSGNNIRGLWLYDEYGEVSTIIDLSTSGRSAILRDAALATQNASNWGPIVSGLSQGLAYCDQSHLWDTQSSGFNFGDGATDSAFSIVTLICPLLTVNSEIVSKDDLTTASTKREFSTALSTSGTVDFNLFDNSSGGYIGKTTAAGVFTANEYQVMSVTYSASATSAGCKIYRNASQVDNANSASGAYTAMEALSAKPGSYRISSAGVPERGYRGKLAFTLIVAEELTALQIRRLSNLLLAYVGTNI